MKAVPKELEIEITDTNLTEELEVEVDYRCFFTEQQAFAPTTVSGSIHHKHTLQDFIKQGKKNYEKQYQKVEVIEVRVGDFI